MWFINEYCDLLITGSGPSGLASAYAAAKNGARVILAEDKPRFGGSLLTSLINKWCKYRKPNRCWVDRKNYSRTKVNA